MTGNGLADAATANVINHFLKMGGPTHLRPSHDGQAFLSSDLCRLEKIADARSIDRDRFLDKHVFVGRDRRFEVNRTKDRRCRQDDQINVTFDHALMGIEAGKHPIGSDLVDIFEGQTPFPHRRFDISRRCLQVVSKEVSQGNQLDGRIRFRTIDDSRADRATVSRSDHADLDAIRVMGGKDIGRGGQ